MDSDATGVSEKTACAPVALGQITDDRKLGKVADVFNPYAMFTGQIASLVLPRSGTATAESGGL